MRRADPLTPGAFAVEFERLAALAAGLAQLNLPRVLSTVEAELHHGVLGDVDPTLLREVLEAAAVVARVAPLRGRAASAVRSGRLPQEDGQAWAERGDPQPARTKRGSC